MRQRTQSGHLLINGRFPQGYPKTSYSIRYNNVWNRSRIVRPMEELRHYLKYEHVDITSEIKVYVLFFDRLCTLPKFLSDHQPKKNLEVGDAAIRGNKPKSRLEGKKRVISNGKPVRRDLASDLFIIYKHIIICQITSTNIEFL